MAGKDSKKLKREQAEKRNEERAKRSPREQLAHLDAKFGPGQGAAKERALLAALMVGAGK
jgi:hypothetical protein